MKNTSYIKVGQAAFIGSALIYLGSFLVSTFNNEIFIQSSFVYLLQVVTSVLLSIFFFNLKLNANATNLQAVSLSLISSILLAVSNLGLFVSAICNLSTVSNIFLVVCGFSYILLTISVFLVVYKFKHLYSGITISSAIVTLIFSQLMFCLLLNNILDLQVIVDLTYTSILCIAGAISSAMLFLTFTRATKSIA